MPIRSEKQTQSHHALTANVRSGPRRALLLGLRRSGQARESMRWPLLELTALAREIELEVVYTAVQTFSQGGDFALGTGKLREILQLMRGGDGNKPCLEPAADVLLVDAVLSPHQQRALTTALEVEVVDRTQLVLQIFAQRARTRAAKLTIEIARLRHELPRLREDESKRGREGGGGRGERGNTQIALAKQRTRERLRALEQQLSLAERALAAQRERRRDAQRVAIVGYTNAGKSSWLSALSQSPTLVADKPFATLETTVRSMHQSSHECAPILLSDTVGFVRDLPHALVPSFHATLEEARDARLLVCVADASDPNLVQQREVTERTLREIGAERVPRLWLLNKADRIGARARDRLRADFPSALIVSARLRDDVARVRAAIAAHFELSR